MFTWKRCMAATATALLAATAAQADDAPAAIAAGSAQAEPVSMESRAVPVLELLRGQELPFLKRVPGDILVNDVDLLKTRSEYWLGVIATRPSPALQAQLKLPKDEGLVVEALQAESPAAKAGVKPYDILLKGNDKPLTGLHDLMQLINEVKDGKLKLDLLRAGKHETVTVTPAKRPAHELGEASGAWIPKGWRAVGGLSQIIDPNVMPGEPLQLQIIRPGQILPPGSPVTNLPGGGLTTMEITVRAKANLADGSIVEITRHGAEPAQVVVTHDKEKWEGTSSDLSKIPKKIRPEVQELLHPAFDHFPAFGGSGGGSVTVMGGGLGGTLAVPPNVEKRLSEMQKQIDELRHSVDALQGKAEKKSE
ncbi:MAG: PDZ domain-containing protein [Thermoguttaceae bacterium]